MSKILPAILIAGVIAAITVGALAQEAPAEGPGDEPEARGPRPPRGPDRFFARHDANEDGKVTLEELCAPAKKLMTDADKDGDGAITKEELEAAHEVRRAQKGEGEGMRRRGPRGRGAEGRGPRGEGREGRGSRGEGGERRGPRGEGGMRHERPSPEEIFKRLDKDADGNLSLEEFKAGARHRGPRGGRR